MVQAQRDGWTLEVYHPSCPVREAWGRKGSSRPDPPEGCLVSRQRDKEIADHLKMTPNTLHAHLGRMYRKLHVHNRKQPVAKFIRVWRGGRVAHFSPFM
jgi:hypothetical protein